MKIKYFNTFYGYGEKPGLLDPIGFEETEGLGAYYIGHFEDNELMKFEKYLYQWENDEIIEINTPKNCKVGDKIYFKVDNDQIGEQLSYKDTPGHDKFFKGLCEEEFTKIRIINRSLVFAQEF